LLLSPFGGAGRREEELVIFMLATRRYLKMAELAAHDELKGTVATNR
jgi:hypothetical protein